MSIGSIGSTATAQSTVARALPERPAASANAAAKVAPSPSEEASETAAERKMEVSSGEEGEGAAKNVPPGVGQTLNVVG